MFSVEFLKFRILGFFNFHPCFQRMFDKIPKSHELAYVRKYCLAVCEQVNFKLACSATKTIYYIKTFQGAY